MVRIALARLACSLLVASACACSLDEEGLAPSSSQTGGSGGSVAAGGKPSAGAPNGGSWSGGASGESGMGGAAGAAGSSGGNENGGTAGAAGFAGSAGATGGSAGATAPDCASVFGSVPHVIVCPDQPAGGCRLAYGATLGAALSCDDVCSAAGVTCAAAFDDLSNQACVLPPVEIPLLCSQLPNSAVCYCSP